MVADQCAYLTTVLGRVFVLLSVFGAQVVLVVNVIGAESLDVSLHNPTVELCSGAPCT